MATTKKATADKATQTAAPKPDAEVVMESKAMPAVPGDDATADELAYFIHHNPVYRTLLPEERDALTERLIESKRQA
ncbi:MAG: hypothetical protein J7556_15065 [Acidovorax sp.]|nr:hypothetical protein [Acidovorax sp.]